MARLAAAAGDTQQVVALADLAGPRPDCELVRWGLLLAVVGELDRAREVAARIADPDHRRRLAEALDDAPALAAIDDAGDDAGDDGVGDLCRPAPDAAPDAVHLRFLERVGGRRDLYARQWYDERRRRSGYRPVREPLTARVVAGHLAGHITLGQYVLWPDASVSFGVIDLDLSASVMAELRAGHGPTVSPLAAEELRTYVTRLRDAGRRLDLPLAVEDSGGRGAHLWLLLAQRRSAATMRAVLAQVVDAAGPPPAEISVELFPKQSRPGARGLSSLVKLPLGLHRVTLRRCMLLDDALAPIEDPAAALTAMVRATPAAYDAVAHRRSVPLPAPEGAVPGPLPAVQPEGSARTLGEALRAITAGRDTRDACERMIDGCAVLAALVERAYERHRLAAAEARAVIYTLGLIGPEPALAAEVLAVAGASPGELARARKGTPSPAGCRRIARLASKSCTDCARLRGAVPYRTPALYAIGAATPATPRPARMAAWMDVDERAVATPFDEIVTRLDRIERRLARSDAEATKDAPGRQGEP